MSISAAFNSIPTTRQNASLYQAGKETIRLADMAASDLEKLDNKKARDQNPTDGVVLVKDVPAHKFEPNFNGLTLKGKSLPSPAFEISNYADGTIKQFSGAMDTGRGSLEAKLTTDGGGQMRLGRNATAESTEYTFKPGSAFFGDHLPDLTASVSADGTMTVTQDHGRTIGDRERERDELISAGPSGVERAYEAYANSLDMPYAYDVDKQGLERADGFIAGLRGLDNTAADLNPEPGIVVTADFGRFSSEAHLYFDPATGVAREACIGLGNHDSFTYSRDENGTEHFLLAEPITVGWDNEGEVHKGFERTADGKWKAIEHNWTTQAAIDHQKEVKQAQKEYDARSWGYRLFHDRPR